MLSYRKSLRDLNNLKDLHTLALEEKDEETIMIVRKNRSNLQDVKKEEINCFLSGENDSYDIVEIHAGAGGTKA